MEEYKIINGLRHYRLSPNEAWRVDNRTEEQVAKRRGNEERNWKPYEPSSSPVISTRSRRKKAKSPWKSILAWVLIIGTVAGLAYNHFHTSEEENIIKQYMETLQNVEGEERNE